MNEETLQLFKTLTTPGGAGIRTSGKRLYAKRIGKVFR